MILYVDLDRLYDIASSSYTAQTISYIFWKVKWISYMKFVKFTKKIFVPNFKLYNTYFFDIVPSNEGIFVALDI